MGLHNPPALEDLLNIEGIASVESINDNTLRINFTHDADATDKIVEQAVAGNWGLYKLNPADTSLETIFMRLTYSDQSAVEMNHDQ